MKTRKEHNQQIAGLIFFLLLFIGLGTYCAIELEAIERLAGIFFSIGVIIMIVGHYYKYVR